MAGKRVLYGVTGGIAAYKAPLVVRLLVKAGAQVRCILTRAAEEFVTARTLETVSGHRVHRSVFEDSPDQGIDHIRLADETDLLLIAPATAHVVARLALGLADDLLGTVALATRAPLLIAPAMNVNMWQHPATRQNLATLLARGARVVGPAEGELACGWTGAGRMVEPEEILAAVTGVLAPGPLAGKKVVVTAGPTWEPIDPVRFVGNRSSGKMGFALAAAARDRGAEVRLIAGPVAVADPPGVRVEHVESALEMQRALEASWRAADVVVMAAAVADFRPERALERKLDRRTDAALTVPLVANPDLLATVGRARRDEGLRRPLLVGFAAETLAGEALVARARQKLGDKGCDLVIANDVSGGAVFGEDESSVVIVDARSAAALGPAPKAALAGSIWDRIATLL